MTTPTTTALVEELRRLVAWPTQGGAASATGLRELARRSQGLGEANDRVLFAAVMRLIGEAVQALDGPISVLLPGGRTVEVEAAKARRAFLMLFWLGRSDRRASHETRRAWVLRELGLNMTVDHWRRDGPEAAFLAVLADRLAHRQSTPDRYSHEFFDLAYLFNDDGQLFEQHISARLRAEIQQVPVSKLTLVTDSYPGHQFRLTQLIGCEAEGALSAPEGLPLRVEARGPALREGDALNVAATFSVTSAGPINHVAWIMGVQARTASIRLRFHPKRVPARIWCFDGAPSPEEGMVSPSSTSASGPFEGTFFRTFTEPRRDRWFGVFWSWTE